MKKKVIRVGDGSGIIFSSSAFGSIMTWYKKHEIGLITAMTILDIDSVFSLIRIFDFGNSHHDHVIIVTITN